jgi:hypothetical protein
MPPNHPADCAIQPAGLLLERKLKQIRKAHMGMVMVKCPQTGRAIPTGIKTDRDSFRRSPVFFARTRCPICDTDHAWFARDGWVDEPIVWERRSAGFSA